MGSTRRQLHLGISLDGAGRHPAAWREPDAAPGDLFSGRQLARLAQEAERGTLDFVTLEDSFALRSPRPDRVRGRLDALLALARTAPLTSAVGLIPVVDTTHTEPFHISKNVATLDHVSQGRAGWRAAVSTTAAVAAKFGRKAAAPPAELYAEAAEAIDVVARLWDSWEDDAVIRDPATGRYVDRDRLHYVDFEGRFFAVRGPSITPRPPQGQPLVGIDVTRDGATTGALDVAAAGADLAFLEAADVEEARAWRAEIRTRAAAAGRDPDHVAVLTTFDVLLAADEAEARSQRARLDQLSGGESGAGPLDFVGSPAELAALIEEWFGAGAADGFTLRPALLPRGLTQVVDEVVPLLRARGVFRRRYEGRTLREHFGLPRPANRYGGDRQPG